MASSDPVVQVLRVMPPGTLYATEDVRVGGSTPAETIIVHDFDATSAEYVDFLCALNGYDGGGLTFTIPWMASSATSGAVRWEIAIRRIVDDAEDLDASHSYSYQGVTDTAPSASGEVSYPTIVFTDGAQMDSWADGELAIVRLRRDPAHAGDDMSGDAEALGVLGRET